MNIQSDLIPRLATGFCGGIAYSGELCGAVSAGVISLGIAYGRTSHTDNKDLCYQSVTDFRQRFAAKFGSQNCSTLTGVDLGTAEGLAAYREKGQLRQCAQYVGEAVGILLDIMEHNRPD